MLHKLYQIERRLPELLRDRAAWQSLFVDYHPPFVERLWRQVDDLRVYLHRIHPCYRTEALFHPHPWPSAMRVINGEYEMIVGHGEGDVAPPSSSPIILSAGSRYEMIGPDEWHSVRPLEVPTLSLMITGTPWNRPSPKSTKVLRPLAPDVATKLLEEFIAHYQNWNQS